MRIDFWAVAALACCFGVAGATAQQPQTEPPLAVPGVITGGSGDVSVGGMPAARSGDATDQNQTLAGGSPNVFINGRPAVTLGDRTGCGGVAVGGASNVFINGKPVARSGDLTTGCPEK
jgi:uncharacterized Zn-binding protein involved in type VI secretion